MREALKKPLHRRHTTGLMVGAVLMLLIHVMGTLGYHYLGRPAASWIDSFYMTFITVATIGFGEVVDLTHHPMGRLFTVFIAVVGIGTMSYVFSKFVALLVDSDLNTAIRTTRMEKQITKLQSHYIVCGIGRVGSNVAMELLETQRDFVVIESDLAALERWLEHHPDTLYLHADAADDDALQRAGVAQSAGVFAVTGDDSHNLMVSMSVKLLNPKSRVVARLHDIRNSAKARKAGADEIVSPDFTGGMRIASAMVRPHVVNFIDQMLHSDSGLRMEEVVIPPGFAARTLSSMAPRAQEYLVMAVRENNRWVFNPADDHLLQSGATLVFMADTGGRQALEKRLSG